MQTKSFRNSYQLRPIEITDAEQIHAMHQRTSSDSLYFRYMRSYQPNYRDAQSIVIGKGLVIIHERAEKAIVGYAYFVADRDKPFEAEFAMLLEDGYQGLGLGRYLLSQLCRYASSNGIEMLNGSIHGSNNIMKYLLHSLDYPIQSVWEYSEYAVALDLTSKKQEYKKRPERG